MCRLPQLAERVGNGHGDCLGRVSSGGWWDGAALAQGLDDGLGLGKPVFLAVDRPRSAGGLHGGGVGGGSQVDGREPGVVDELGDDVFGCGIVVADEQHGPLVAGPVGRLGLEARGERVEGPDVAGAGHARRVERRHGVARGRLGVGAVGVGGVDHDAARQRSQLCQGLVDGSPRHGQHHHVGDGHRMGGGRGADVVAELAGAGGKLVGVPGQADDHVVTGP